MSDHAITAMVSILLAVIGVAVIAVIVSKQSNTSNVLGAGASSLEQAICVALSPITGGKCGTSVSSTITFGGEVPILRNPKAPGGDCFLQGTC